MIPKGATICQQQEETIGMRHTGKRINQSISVAEAGRRGGLVILRTRGRSYFVELGHRGQRAMRLRYPGMASEWGRLGGRPRKPNLEDTEEEAKILKEGRMGPALESTASSPTSPQNHNMYPELEQENQACITERHKSQAQSRCR